MPMKTLQSIRKVLVMHKQELKKKYKIRELAIFGSYARGEQKKTSDVDILVDFDKVPDLLTVMNMERYLEELLGTKVDSVRKSAIRPELKNTILKEAVKV